MSVITYSITLEEPVLVTALDGDPNSAVTFDYLPGSVLRGAIVGRYLREHDSFDAADPNIQRLFFDGGTRFLNGFPRGGDGNRTVPTPASWHREKGQDSEIDPSVVDLARFEGDGEMQWKSLGAPFCEIEEGEESSIIRFHKPERRLAVHTLRHRDKGRSTSDYGAVFRYESLAAGQTFDAVILCDEDSDAETIRNLLSGTVHIGGSRTAGYGKVRFENVKIQDERSWREVEPMTTSEDSSRLVLTFLSDTIIRDAFGTFSASLKAIETTIREAVPEIEDLRVVPEHSFPVTTVVGGFNRKWGLPLPQCVAVKMGSVVVFKTGESDGDAANTVIEALCWAGIGERRAEGFGRVAVNIQTQECYREVQYPPETQSPISISNPVAEEQARRMVNRMMERRLEGLIVTKANLTTIENPPRNSQLSGLRKVIQSELMKEVPRRQPIVDFLDSVKRRQVSRRQFEKAKIKTTPLLKWLNAKLDDGTNPTERETWESIFNAHDPKDYKKRVGNIESELTEAKKLEMTLRLMDAVLAKAGKENRKKGD